MNGYNIFDGVDDYIQSSTIATVAAYPLTISCRLKPEFYNSQEVGVSLLVVGSSNQYLVIGLANMHPWLQARNTASKDMTATMSVPQNTWCHITGVFESATSRKLYYNGRLLTDFSTNQQDSVLLPAVDTVLISVLRTSTPLYYFNGGIKDVKIWTRALSTSEIVRDSIYHTDYSNVPTTNLVHFFKLGGNYFDYGTGGATLTNSGSVAIPQLTGGSGTRSIATRHPVTDGLTTQITTQTGHIENLKPEEGSLVPRKNKTGITGL